MSITPSIIAFHVNINMSRQQKWLNTLCKINCAKHPNERCWYSMSPEIATIDFMREKKNETCVLLAFVSGPRRHHTRKPPAAEKLQLIVVNFAFGMH